MEQASMERTSRLPLAPSRLPLGGGARVQMAATSGLSGSGLPRLFCRPPQGPPSTSCEMAPPQLPVPPSGVQHHPEEQELTLEEQEWKDWVGKRVCISGIKKGTLMYFGTTSFAEGLFCGISLDEKEGRHDGELNGRRYFNCPPQHGVFAPISKVERVICPKLPPIRSPLFSTDGVNRTFPAGLVPSHILNETFSQEKLSSNVLSETRSPDLFPPNDFNETYSPELFPSKVLNETFSQDAFPSRDLNETYSHGTSPSGAALNETFVPRRLSIHNGTFLGSKTPSPVGKGFNGTFVSKTSPVVSLNDTFLASTVALNDTFGTGKPQSFGPDLDKMLQLATTPTSHNHRFHHHHHQQQHVSSPQNSYLRDDSPGCFYDEDESSLGILTDSQMGDFTMDGLSLMPKTQSCDDIHDLPEEEVVQDITVQYIEDPANFNRFPIGQSTPILTTGVKAFLPDLSALEDGSFSMIADQEFPSCALDATLGNMTEATTNPVSDDISQQSCTTEMPEEVAPISISAILETIASKSVHNNPNIPDSKNNSSFVVRSAFAHLTVEPVLVNRVAANAALFEELASKTFTGTPETSVKHQLGERSVNDLVADVQLREKGQRSLETSLTKSVEWNDVVLVQSGDDCKEERLSIEKVMEVIQAKGASGQRPASTYTVGSADTGYQGDAEFDMQSEIETASPSEEVKQLVSSSVCTSLSMDDAASALSTGKMGKSDPLSDSDFFTEDPGDAEGSCSPDAAEVTMVAMQAANQVTEPLADNEQETEVSAAANTDQAAAKSNADEETEDPMESRKPSSSECGTLKKKKKTIIAPPPKKIVGVSKIKALLESQPSADVPKRARTPKKSRWDAVTLKIQANMADDKVKPKREVRGRVNTNLVAARTAPAVPSASHSKKTDTLGRLGGSESAEGSGTPVAESVNTPVDGDDTASQATTSARASRASTYSQCQDAAPLSSSSSLCSLSSVPSTSQQQQQCSKGGIRVPSKIAVRFQPRLEPVATVREPTKRSTARAPRGGAAPKTPKPAATAVKGPSVTPPTTPQTPTGGGTAPQHQRLAGPGSRTGTPTIRSALSTASPLVIPSSSRQQRQKLEELGREVQHLGGLCESRTKELNRVKMQLRHASLGFDAFATLVQYLAGELNAFSHPDLVSEIQTTKEQLITLETFLKQCEGDLEEMREKHVEELGVLSRQLQQAQGNTAQLQEKLEQAEQEHSKQCEDWDHERKRIETEAQARHQATLDITQAQHVSQIEGLLAEHTHNMDICDARHKEEQTALTDQLEVMKGRCRELQEQARSIEEALEKDTDTKIQWLSAKNADLQKEVESLKSVLEMKQGELHELRKENLIISKQAEELPVYRQRVSKLMSRIEELQALLREKSKNERRLSCDQRNLQEHLQKESKMNRQLSMEKDELMWRLSQSMTSSTGSLDNSSFLMTPDFTKKKRVIPFSLTPCSLTPFREGSQDETTQNQDDQTEEHQFTSTSGVRRVQHKARVRVNRTRSCHTSPRDSPSHNSRMVTSTPNMPCDDDNNSIDEASSTSRLSPCDSLTELHRKACMQLDCIDDCLLQQKQQQQQQQQMFSPNGISSPNSSMTSSAAEDLSLSSTEDERRNDHKSTSPRSLAGEAMTEEMRISMATPESPPPGENVAPPSDTPCFCDDYDVSSEPE